MIRLLRSDSRGRVRFAYKLAVVSAKLARELVVAGRRMRRSERAALDLAFARWRWAQLNHAGRRPARRQLRHRLGAAAAASALLLMGSIASPTGMGNDGQRAYDMATRTWYGPLVGPLIAALGKPWYDVTNPAFVGGARGDLISDDVPAINSAIGTANPLGGIVYFPLPAAGGYLASSALTPLASSTALWGTNPFVGGIFGDTLKGSVIKVSPGAYDLVTSQAAAKGVQIRDLFFDGGTDSTHWVIRMFGVSGGLEIHYVGIRQYATGHNAVYLDGGGSGIFGARVDHLEVFCGGGFTGGTAFKMGNTAACNANTMVDLVLVGYVTGLDNNNGGGNTYVGTWVQSCTTGIRLNSSLCTVVGGWWESLTTGAVFTAASVNNTIIAVRRSGSVTTLYTDAGAGNRLIAMDGTDYGDEIHANTAFVEWRGTDGAIRGRVNVDGSNVTRLAGVATSPSGTVALATSDTAGTVVDRVQIVGSGVGAGAGLQAHAQVYPGQPTIGFQTAAGLLGGTGVPNNANGNNGDKYFRSDSGALTTIYDKRAGAWVGVV